MNFTTFAQNKFELSKIKDSGINEVILSFNSLSRFSKQSKDEFIQLALFAKELNLKVILEWDILITEVDFEQNLKEFESLDQKLFDVIRVQDAGILEYVLSETNLPIQLNLETGNHNLVGIKKWISYCGERLERVVLSIELNKQKIEEYSKALDCEIELLVTGPVLLFYSPRKLLSVLLPEDDELKTKTLVSKEYLEAIGESEESPHKGFPILENKHGTFMFHIKDLFLLDRYDEIKELGLSHLRIDLRSKGFELFDSFVSSKLEENNFKLFKEAYGKDVIRGYYQINKSDALFKKLKNYRIQRKDNSYLGEVIEATKSSHLAIDLKGKLDLKTDQQLKFITPEGKEYRCKVHELRSIDGVEKSIINAGNIGLMNYMGNIWVKSQVYLE